LAKELRSHVMAGVAMHGSGELGRNEALVLGPDGQLVVRYCKMYPFSLAGENKHFEAGQNTESFTWHDVRVAPFVCYDLRFPEIFRRAAADGAELMAVVANWPAARVSHWTALLRARAIENQAYVVGVNRAGSDPHVAYSGH